MTFKTTKLEIMMTLFWKKFTYDAPSAYFSTKVQTFLLILKIYNCLKLPFNVTIREYL